MTAYGYCRVSTGRQADEGESLGTQERMINGYCEMKGLAAPVLFIERGVSGSIALGDRSQGRELLSALKPGDVLIVPKLDRAFRSALDALDVLGRFQKAGIELHIIDLGGDVTGNGISKLVFTILAAVAEGERDRIRERVKEVKRGQANRGRYLGGAVPFGWRVDSEGQLVEHVEEQAQLRRAKLLKQQGQSLRDISARLKQDGCDVSHNTLARVLRAA